MPETAKLSSIIEFENVMLVLHDMISIALDPVEELVMKAWFN